MLDDRYLNGEGAPKYRSLPANGVFVTIFAGWTAATPVDEIAGLETVSPFPALELALLGKSN